MPSKNSNILKSTISITTHLPLSPLRALGNIESMAGKTASLLLEKEQKKLQLIIRILIEKIDNTDSSKNKIENFLTKTENETLIDIRKLRKIINESPDQVRKLFMKNLMLRKILLADQTQEAASDHDQNPYFKNAVDFS